MAGNKITRKDIVEEKVLSIGQDYAKGLQPAVEANDKWLKSFAPIKTAALEYANIEKQFKVSSGRKEFLTIKEKELGLTEQVKVSLIEQQKLEKQLIATKQKQILSTESTSRALAKEKLELNLLNKGVREAATLSSSLAGEYAKVVVKMNQAAKTVQNLTAKRLQGNKLSNAEISALKKAELEFARYNKAVVGADASVKRFQRNVGNYPKALSAATSAARNLAGALGLVGGAFLVVRTVRDAINVLKDYEKQNATLSAILQVEKEDMKGLRKESVRLGSTTVKTAGEVTELQIAYARLGFSQSEIIDLTESTISGSIAMNSQLDQTATLVGAIVNTFDDLSTTDAPRIIDILSLSTAKSALNFEKLEKGIPIVAGAANAAGIPFTKLVSLMGKLADSGIDVSTSSTALRNIFIESAKQGLNYAQIVQKIKDSQDKLTAANDEFGKRAAVSATVLAQNIDATNELDDALNKAAGTAERMANKELDTLDGSLKLLRSAWEGYVLGVDKAGNVSNQLKDFVKNLADNLNDILNTIVKVTKVFFVYIGVSKAINAITVIYTALKIGATAAELSFAKATGIGRKAVLAEVAALEAATTAQTALNIATKATPWGLILGLLSAAAAAFFVFRDSTKEATEELNKFNKEVDILTKGQNRFETALNKVAAGRERANAALGEQFAVTDRLENTLRKAGIAEDEIGRIKEYAFELSKLSNEEIAKEADLYETGSDKKNAAVRSALKLAAANIKITNSIIDENILLEKNTKETDKNSKAKQNAAAEKKRRNDSFLLESFILNQQIDEQKAIANNDKEFFFKRQEAIQNQALFELDLAKLTAEKKLQDIKGYNQKEIDALLSNDRLTVEQTQKLTDEQLLIYKEYQAKKKEIISGKESATDSLEIERIKTEAATAAAIQETKLNNELDAENKAFLAKEGIYQDQLKAVENYEKRIAEIKKKYAIQGLKDQLTAAEALLESLPVGSKARIEAERKIAAIKKAISQISTDDFIEKQQLEIDAVKRTAEFIKSIQEDLKNVLLTIADNVFQSRLQNIDDEIARNDERYERILDNEQLSEENRKAIEKRQEESRKELEKKRRQEERKAAIFNKVIAIGSIAIETAKAISAAYAPPPVGLGPLLGSTLLPLIISKAALQTAAVAAVKIPSYAKGTKDHPGGPALVAEDKKNGKFVPEVVTEPSKKPYIVDKPTVLDLPKHTKVTPSLEEYEKLMRASMLASVDINNNKLNTFQAKVSVNNNYDELVKEMRLTREAIKKQPKQAVHFHERKIDINHAIWASKNRRWHG